MYTVFQDLNSFECYTVSKNSLEYPDYLKMVEVGKMKDVFHGRKRECEEYVDESVLEAA